jgi:hypothetical protein
MDAAAAQPGQLTKAQSGAEEGGDVVLPEHGEAGQQPTRFLGRECAPFRRTEYLLGVGAALGWRDLADRVGVDCWTCG